MAKADYSSWSIWQLYCECGKRGLVEKDYAQYISKKELLQKKLQINDADPKDGSAYDE